MRRKEENKETNGLTNVFGVSKEKPRSHLYQSDWFCPMGCVLDFQLCRFASSKFILFAKSSSAWRRLSKIPLAAAVSLFETMRFTEMLINSFCSLVFCPFPLCQGFQKENTMETVSRCIGLPTVSFHNLNFTQMNRHYALGPLEKCWLGCWWNGWNLCNLPKVLISLFAWQHPFHLWYSRC